MICPDMAADGGAHIELQQDYTGSAGADEGCDGDMEIEIVRAPPPHTHIYVCMGGGGA